MALLSVQNIVRTGLAPSYAAVAASDTFVPGPLTFLHVKNAGGTVDNVTFTIPTSIIASVGFTMALVAVPITTGDRMIGPIPGGIFADPATGLVTVNHSFITTVTCAVLNLQMP